MWPKQADKDRDRFDYQHLRNQKFCLIWMTLLCNRAIWHRQHYLLHHIPTLKVTSNIPRLYLYIQRSYCDCIQNPNVSLSQSHPTKNQMRFTQTSVPSIMLNIWIALTIHTIIVNNIISDNNHISLQLSR